VPNIRSAGSSRGYGRQLSVGDADDHRAVGDRGRETFGEPKKLAEVTLTRDGDHVKGLVTRLAHDHRAERADHRSAKSDRGSRTDFYFKFLPAPDGKGFDSEPSLVYCHRDETSRSVEAVDGEVILRESRFDPVADLPVRRLIGMTLSERRSVQRGEIVSRVPAEWVLPTCSALRRPLPVGTRTDARNVGEVVGSRASASEPGATGSGAQPPEEYDDLSPVGSED